MKTILALTSFVLGVSYASVSLGAIGCDDIRKNPDMRKNCQDAEKEASDAFSEFAKIFEGKQTRMAVGSASATMTKQDKKKARDYAASIKRMAKDLVRASFAIRHAAAEGKLGKNKAWESKEENVKKLEEKLRAKIAEFREFLESNDYDVGLASLDSVTAEYVQYNYSNGRAPANAAGTGGGTYEDNPNTGNRAGAGI